MTRERPRPHALLAPELGPPGPPYMPTVGELYLVRTLLYSSSDPAVARRAAVITVPAVVTVASRIQLATRTSDPSAPGVKHQRDMSVDCDRDGVFSNLVSCLASSWRSGDVKPLGVLPDHLVDELMDRFS